MLDTKSAVSPCLSALYAAAKPSFKGACSVGLGRRRRRPGLQWATREIRLCPRTAGHLVRDQAHPTGLQGPSRYRRIHKDHAHAVKL